MADLQPTPKLSAAHSTLLDALGRPLHDLRVSVTDRCNFRCGYCMPADAFPEGHRFLPTSDLLTFDEIERAVGLFVTHLGARKIRLTGGEPLLRPELPRLVERLSRIDGIEELTLTTNGYLLAEHARALADAGLSRITVSLDSIDSDEFAHMSGAGRQLARVIEGIEAAVAVGLSPLKLNCVVIRGKNESAILALAERFRGTPHVVRYIEYMDVGTQNAWRESEVISARDIVERIHARWPLTATAPTYTGEVARRYRYDDGAGEIGVISSVTAPFCGDCHRARLSADGRLLTCLFASGGLDVRALLRSDASDATLVEALRSTWSARSDRYSELRSERTATHAPRRRLEMYQVGG